MKFTKPAFLITFVLFMGIAGFVFSKSSDVPVIENPNQEVLYCAHPVAVALAISIENIQVNEADEGIKISISDYIKGEDILEYDAVGSFQYRWDENSDYLEITGVGPSIQRFYGRET